MAMDFSPRLPVPLSFGLSPRTRRHAHADHPPPSVGPHEKPLSSGHIGAVELPHSRSGESAATRRGSAFRPTPPWPGLTANLSPPIWPCASSTPPCAQFTSPTPPPHVRLPRATPAAARQPWKNSISPNAPPTLPRHPLSPPPAQAPRKTPPCGPSSSATRHLGSMTISGDTISDKSRRQRCGDGRCRYRALREPETNDQPNPSHGIVPAPKTLSARAQAPACVRILRSSTCRTPLHRLRRSPPP
jgi:hypothetical protein